MIRRFVRSLIRNATVTGVLDSAALRLDPVLMGAMEVGAFEEVEVVNVSTGARFTTWVEAGAAGDVCVAHVRAGDIVTILSHGLLHDGQTLAHKVRIVVVDAHNRVVTLTES